MRLWLVRLLITTGFMVLLVACESLPDEKALAVNDPAFDTARSSKNKLAPCVPINAPAGALRRHYDPDYLCSLRKL
jgi:hypothetical protein